MGSLVRTSRSVAQEEWRYPRPEYYRRPLKPIVVGTIFWHPEVALVEGYAKVTGHRIFIADVDGRMHEVSEWELSQAELSGRRVKDPERRAYLFNPQREKHRGDPFDPDAPKNFREIREYLAKLADKMAMPTNVLVQREPGEEG